MPTVGSELVWPMRASRPELGKRKEGSLACVLWLEGREICGEDILENKGKGTQRE